MIRWYFGTVNIIKAIISVIFSSKVPELYIKNALLQTPQTCYPPNFYILNEIAHSSNLLI